jgi:probable phosphoglycerate mutase
VTTVLLIRHADYELVGKALAGRTPGLHLDERGRIQADRLANRLDGVPLSAIYSSPLERARETALPVSEKFKIPILIRDALNEIDFGAWTGSPIGGMRGSEWDAFNRLRSTARIPSGELMLEVQARLVNEINGLCARHPQGVLALVSHGDVIRAGIAHFAGIPLDLFQRIEISTASVSKIEFHDHGPKIVSVNET